MIGPDRFIDYFATGRHSAVRKSAQAARARANGASSVCTGHNPTELVLIYVIFMNNNAGDNLQALVFSAP